jgi:FkbM family methyltransferase
MDKRFQNILKKIEEYTPDVPFWQKNPGDIFVYGTGTMGEEVCKVLIQRGLPVRGFLDHKIKSTSLSGFPVMASDDPQLSLLERSTANIVLAIHNPYADIPAICSQLNKLGYKHTINAIELYDYLGDELGMRYWLVQPTFYKSLESILKRVYDLWADDTSRDIFTAILEHRIGGDYNCLPQVDWEHRYAPVDIPAWKSPMRLIDCGAFDGDSIADLQKAGVVFDAIAAFEPDSNTFQKLVGFFHLKPTFYQDVSLWPCGVYSSTIQLQFDASQNAASSINTEGYSSIQCVAIDEVLINFAPTLIKMDIEGAEYDALLGMQRTIQQYKPGLAISLYHHPAHLWQIPLLVEQLANNLCQYKYFVRLHQRNGYDLVFYAVPSIE